MFSFPFVDKIIPSKSSRDSYFENSSGVGGNPHYSALI